MRRKTNRIDQSFLFAQPIKNRWCVSGTSGAVSRPLLKSEAKKKTTLPERKKSTRKKGKKRTKKCPFWGIVLYLILIGNISILPKYAKNRSTMRLNGFFYLYLQYTLVWFIIELRNKFKTVQKGAKRDE